MKSGGLFVPQSPVPRRVSLQGPDKKKDENVEDKQIIIFKQIICSPSLCLAARLFCRSGGCAMAAAEPLQKDAEAAAAAATAATTAA